MTINQKYYLGASAAIVAVFAGTLVAYPYLPASVPMHWDAHGQVNGWGPKWSLLLSGPGLMALMVLLFSALPWLSPKRFEVDSFRATYLYIMIAIVALLAYIHLLVLSVVLGAELGVKFNVSRAVMGGVCLLITLTGNVLGKVRRNFFIGVRTPWTIASEPVWISTHRFAARTFFAGGLAGLAFAILGAPFWLALAAILTATLAPVFYSLIVYKQLERRGGL
jgi:uncharacterized membrane protein